MDDFDDLSTLKSMREGWEKLLGKIDDYELLCELGGGGFGTVYLAKDAVSGVEYAVKGLPPEVKNSLEEQENIRANFKLVSRLSHTNIARAYVLHRAKSVWYASEEVRQKLRVLADDTLMVMEYAPGTTLSKWRRQFPEGKVPEGQALEIVRQIADALDYAHGQKIIHRDIKPSNVMVETKPDGRLTVRVLDFGLAAEIRSSMGRVSREVRDMSGTRPYMAPEQWQGEKQTAATDQYALAVLCHELLTGTVPFASVFETGDVALMKNVVATTPFAAPRELPRRIRAALEKALAKKPGERFASCAEFADALAGRVKMKGKGGVAKALLAAACVAALAAGAWQYWQNHARLSEPAPAAKPAPVPAVPAAPAPAPDAKPAPVPAVPAAPAPAPAAKPAPVSSARPETDEGSAATGRRQQLWEGGPYWADRNVGASSPEDSGLYFWWGDTVGYKRQGGAWVASDGSTSGFSFEEGNVPTFGLSELRARGWITAAGVLAPEHDAARVKWGGAWRMPTYRELKDLEEKCDWTWTTQNGVNGYVVRGKGKYAANSIFLPCTGGGDGASLRNSGSGGYYWSSVPYSGNSYYSWSLYFSWGNHGTYYNNRYRYYGRSVRPVQEFANTGVPEPAPAAKPAPVSSARPETDGGAAATGRGQQLWEGGPYWADRNVGASSPEDSGLYFWWGDTVGYKRQGDAWVASDGSTSGFSFGGNVPTSGKSLSDLRARGWITEAGFLAPEHDAARVKWGGAWRMPTVRELKDLEEKCDWTWTTQNGVNGYVVRGKGKYAANRIFLPCAGYGYEASLYDAGLSGSYWSSVPRSGSYEAWSLDFNSGRHDMGGNGRTCGQSVRPVQGFAQ